MGAGSSTLQAFPSDVFAKTSDARDVINKIFQYLLLQMKMQEYLPLANPDTCKNYVILMADSLEKYFYKMRYFPAQTQTTGGRPAYLYFRKLSDLQGVTPEVSRYCVAIAYFYVRIFQIFGALSLSVLDADTQAYEMYFKGGLLNEGNDEIEYEQEGGAERALTPGELLSDAFAILNPFLRADDGIPKYYTFQGKPMFISRTSSITATFSKRYELLYELELNEVMRARLTKITGEKISKRDRLQVKANLSLESVPKRTTINGELQDIKILVGSSVLKLSIADIALLFYRKGGMRPEYESKGGLSVANSIESKFQLLLSKIFGKKKTDVDTNDENNNNEDDRRKDRKDFDIDVGRRRDSDTWSEAKVKMPYQTQDLWETMKGFSGLTKTRPVKAHCIARAIQLVSSRALEQAVPDHIISSVCVRGFLEPKFSKSIPPYNEDITKEKGLFVLNQLFYDRIAPNLNPSMSQLAKKRYEQTLEYFQQVFKDDTVKAPQELRQIKNRTAAKFCAGEEKEKRKDTRFQAADKGLIQQMRGIVKGMLLRQLDHTAKVTLLLKNLFLLDKGKIQIHPQVLEGGIPVLNKIGEAARDLLINYYVNCEKSYGDGVALLEANRKLLRPF